MDRKNENPWVYKIGFISPPAWFDISPMEFRRIAPENTITLQTLIRPHDFGYKKQDFINSVNELKVCYDSLSGAGADVIVQFGYPFSIYHGWEQALQIQREIENRGDAGFIMMGIEAVNALKHLDCQSIAVASTYYSDRLFLILEKFLTAAGIDVLHTENWQTGELKNEKDSEIFIVEGEYDPMNWETPVQAVQNAVRSVLEQTPEADGVLVTGGGMRVLDIVEDLEKELNKPVIGGDISLYWGIFRRLAIRETIQGYGRLLASLG